jgi:thiamine-monophosphate kinase
MRIEADSLVNAKALGERKIIDIILKRLEQMPDMPVPFGDDVSAVDIGNGKLVVIKTDMLVGKTDVPPGMSMKQAARKAVIMNISDLAAKGVKTIALLVSLGIPKNMTQKEIRQIGEGLNAGAREYDAYILGGDTNEASDFIISCSAFGVAEKSRLVLRSGAVPGDIVAVTGEFGKTASGLQILFGKMSPPMLLRKELVDSVLMPRARLSEGLALARTGAVTASIDSSDGLAWSLHELSRTSNVGFTVDHLPMAKEVEDFARLYNVDPVHLCLYGGEEYELVVTVKPNLFEKVTKKVPLIRIGYTTARKLLTLMMKRKQIPIEARGWEHFKTLFQEHEPFS